MVIVRVTGVTGFYFVDEFVEGCKNFGGLETGHIEEAAPNFGRGREAPRCEAGDDAEVIGAAFEGAPEVRVN